MHSAQQMNRIVECNDSILAFNIGKCDVWIFRAVKIQWHFDDGPLSAHDDDAERARYQQINIILSLSPPSITPLSLSVCAVCVSMFILFPIKIWLNLIIMLWTGPLSSNCVPCHISFVRIRWAELQWRGVCGAARRAHSCHFRFFVQINHLI